MLGQQEKKIIETLYLPYSKKFSLKTKSYTEKNIQ